MLLVLRALLPTRSGFSLLLSRGAAGRGVQSVEIVATGGLDVGGTALLDAQQALRAGGGPRPAASPGVFQRPQPRVVRPVRFSPEWYAHHPARVLEHVASGGLALAGVADISTSRHVGVPARLAITGSAGIETWVNEDEEFLLWLEAA